MPPRVPIEPDIHNHKQRPHGAHRLPSPCPRQEPSEVASLRCDERTTTTMPSKRTRGEAAFGSRGASALSLARDFTCAAQGCSDRVSGLSHYCNGHRKRHKRHGSADQESILAEHLEPYRREVRRIFAGKAKAVGSCQGQGVGQRLPKTEDTAPGKCMRENWTAVLNYARDELRALASGQAHIRWQRLAHLELVKLGDSAEFNDILEVGLAMFLMVDMEPRRFADHRGFRFSLVRRLRGLTEQNVGTYWDHQSGKVKRVYRDFPPRAVEVLADVLTSYFAKAAAYVLSVKRRELADSARRAAALDAAFQQVTSD